jgi:hypothetical protein
LESIYLNAGLRRDFLHGLLGHDTSTGVQVHKTVFPIHLLHSDRADIARDGLLVVVGEAGGLGLREGGVEFELESDHILQGLDVLTNQVAITVSCPVEEKFEDGIPVVELAESARDDGRRKSLLREGAGEPVDPVEDVLVDLGLSLLLLDEFVSLWNRSSITTHVWFWLLPVAVVVVVEGSWLVLFAVSQ